MVCIFLVWVRQGPQKKHLCWKMAQRLRVHTALAEDPSSVPNTYIKQLKTDPYFQGVWCPHLACTITCRTIHIPKHKHITIKGNSFFFFFLKKESNAYSVHLLTTSAFRKNRSWLSYWRRQPAGLGFWCLSEECPTGEIKMKWSVKLRVGHTTHRSFRMKME